MTTRLPIYLLLTLLCSPLAAQLTPATAVAEMARGINLGNTLEPPMEGDWNNGPAEESYFDAYVDAGFTNVRIPVRWDEHTLDSAPYTVDAAWMDRVEEVVDWGLDRGLYITLNTHHEDWLKNGYADPDLRARFDAIWEQIVNRFGDKSEKLLFEIINEPFGMTVAEVDELNARILGIIRADNPTRLVIFGGNQYANAEELVVAAVPEDDYVIGYFHSYDPWSFAGEGTGTWGTAADYQALENKLQRVDSWSQANDVPVHLSEFGAVLQADYNSRMRWYAAYVEAALRHGFAFSVWDDGGMFGILDRADNSWPEVKDVLLYTYTDSPTTLTATASDPADTLNLSVALSWTNRADGNGITVERRRGEEAFAPLVDLAGTAETYTDTAVTKGTFYTYRIVTSRNDGTELQSYPARVLVSAGPQEPFGSAPAVLPGTLQAEDYDRGGESVAYHDSESENIPGGYRPEEGVDIGAAGDGGFAVGYVARGEWLEFSVIVDSAGSYAVTAAVASAVGGGSMLVSNSLNASSVSLRVSGDGTGGYETFEEVTTPGRLNLEAGEQVIRIDFTSEEAFNLDSLTFTRVAADTNAIVNYYDLLDTAAQRFTGSPVGITYGVADGILTISGDGTSPSYQTFRYTLPDSLLADVGNSGNLLFLRARTLSGAPVDLRVDLVDEKELATTVAGRTITVEGTEFMTYEIDYTGGYQDGGYGGTGCDDAPCAVDGNRIVALTFYLEAPTGGFSGTVEIDYLSFGEALDGGGEGPTGIVNYSDNLDGAGDRFTGSPAGLTYTLTDGVLTVVGDGTSGPYPNFAYDLRDENGDAALADAIGSGDLLYIRARAAGDGPVDLRIDLVDQNNFHTTLAGRTVQVSGEAFQTYRLDYAGGYADGGYGGTACTEETQPCPVDGRRIARLVFYVDPETGGFDGTLEIDRIQFGTDVFTSVREDFAFPDLRVYPNPATVELNLAYRAVSSGDVRVRLYDATGRTAVDRRVSNRAGSHERLSVPLRDLSPGLYYLHLLGADGRQSRGYPVRIQ
ncbi:cellulase family glycosylhydrolase [Lewinella sp. IMCC34183]|uniref:cellulase family glycosylhydrolase n=1 Tax=Lewinella sp. IMCC34183 TaxID=2248762 RepID=UPI0018E52E21|nr:cellulase family glycosylhydrolase [Lewinella sp. IMCC34183]